MKSKEKKEKPVFVDDGHTIASMDCEVITGYKSDEQRKNHEEIRKLNLSKKERRAIYLGVFKYFLPYFLCFVAAFVTILLVMYFGMR